MYNIFFKAAPDVELMDFTNDSSYAMAKAYAASKDNNSATVGIVYYGEDQYTSKEFEVTLSYIRAPQFDDAGMPYYPTESEH